MRTPVSIRLPLVSGCGCAYACATGILQNDQWLATLDHYDSRVDPVSLERWCFTEVGSGHPQGESGDSGRCMDVFYDQTACGGECIPSTEFLRCPPDGR